jgi:hypothetical protein
LSLSVELEDRIFRVSADPHLYINKKAVDFAAQGRASLAHQVVSLGMV